MLSNLFQLILSSLFLVFSQSLFVKKNQALKTHTLMNSNSVNEDDEIPEVWLPYIRGEVVNLLESTRKLEISTRRLEISTRRFDRFDSDDNHGQPTILDCLIQNLQESYGVTDIGHIELPVSVKDGYRRAIKDVNGEDLVHWDYIFIAAKNDIDTLIFINAKETKHINDNIMYNITSDESIDSTTKSNLNNKISKTNDYFTNILPLDDSKCDNAVKIQNALLKRYLNAPRCYVYASVVYNKGQYSVKLLLHYMHYTNPVERADGSNCMSI